MPSGDTAGRWLLLLHHLPPKPAYFRAKILRRLAQAGALPLKNSAYLLPDNEDMLEDLEWIAQEIQKDGGAVWLFRVDLLAGQTRQQLINSFVQLRASDYRELLRYLSNVSQLPDEELANMLPKLTRRLDEIRSIDFFESALRTQAEETVRDLEARVRAMRPVTVKQPAHKGRTWVTRQRIKVDRIGSAWLIRRFIDREARFRFVDLERYTHTPGELRFDMFEGEYTHRGEMCTFEVLLQDFDLAGDPGLVALGQMIHDIDLKEDRYHRPETAGLSRLLDGLSRRTSSDEERLQAGDTIFGGFYESLRTQS